MGLLRHTEPLATHLLLRAGCGNRASRCPPRFGRRSTTIQACWLCNNPDGQCKLINLPVKSAKKQISLAEMVAAAVEGSGKRVDTCTLSNHEDIRVTHIDFEFDVDFQTKTIHGFAKLMLAAVVDGVSKVVLDTKDLSVEGAVQCLDDNKEEPLTFSFGEAHKAYGTPLEVQLREPLAHGAEVEVGLHFSTTPSSSATQFLDPAQTKGGKHPFLFTQCQAIHARSFVPCQDTPAVKFTYNAVLRVPEPLTGLMSALPVDDISQKWEPRSHLGRSKDKCRVSFFRQPVPIPAYLLTIVAGNLEARELGARSRVWAEPEVVEAAAWEYKEETSAFLDAAESVAGEYVWGRYDMVVICPSYPYGGMETPNMTMLTPTTISGDRSQTRVVAHEIAHSWFGNLVTNAGWSHFWLNEGWTVYLERRILKKLYGDKVHQFNAMGGRIGMTDTIRLFGDKHGFTQLVPDLTQDGGVDPDDAFSRIPYEKGFHFIYWLQELVGGQDVFDPFVKAYVQKFRFGTVTSDQFRQFFIEYWQDKVPAVKDIDWDTWLYSPGMPPEDNTYDGSLADAPYSLAQRWSDADPTGTQGKTPEGASAADVEGFTAEQMIAFLEKLGELRTGTGTKPLSPVACRAMEGLYKLDDRRNTEMRTAWFKLCIAAGDETILPQTVAFLKEQGRMKYIRPLYRSLLASPSPAAQRLAGETFKEAGPTYHPVAAKMVEADIKAAAQ